MVRDLDIWFYGNKTYVKNVSFATTIERKGKEKYKAAFYNGG